jgi:hypothetical protein
MFAVAAIPLFGLTGAAVDYSRTSALKVKVQSALDAAVLKGADEPSTTQVVTAKAVFRSGLGEDAQFVKEPSFLTEGGLFKGSVSGELPTSIVKLVGFDAIPFAARSAATPRASLNTVCFLLKTSLKMSSSSIINMPGCEIAVQSTSDGAVDLASQSEVNAQRLCVGGTINTSMMKESYKEHCSPVADPFPGQLPVLAADATCTYNNKTYSGNQSFTVTPGNICNGMTFNVQGTVTFAPGLYRVRGGPITFSSSATALADGVTFYFEDSASYINNKASSSFSIKAPTSGTYAGIAMFEKPSLSPSNGFAFNSSSNGTLEGLFYLPSRTMSLNSASSLDARRMTLVADSLTMASSSNFKGADSPDASKRIYIGEVRIAQ